MSQPRAPLGRVCIAGGGQVGVLTAIAVKRALPRCEVLLIGFAPGPLDFADHAASALPFTNKLHDRLGIAEQAIVARAGGSHRLMSRYIGWGDKDRHGTLPHGAGGDPALATAFAREWGGGSRNAGGERPAGSLAEVLAGAGRFCIPPADEETPLAELDYAMRWNPPAYRALLIGEAQRIGVAYAEGAIAGVEPDASGGIASVSLEGHGTITADLFVDCSGTTSRLLAALPDYAIEDWNSVLPERRVLFASPGQGMLALEDRLSLLPEGWLIEFAGRDGLQVMLGAAPGANENELVRALGAQPVFDTKIQVGRVRSAWLGNVVALGDAAARFEPLAFLHLDLAHRMLALLLEMLPGQSIEPLERAEFNRRAGLMMDGVRDILAMHYAAPRAAIVFGNSDVPDRVATDLDQFGRRGRLPFQDEQPLLGQERMALLRALGFAEGVPPQNRAADPRHAEAALKAFEAKAKAALAYAPPYGEWMTAQLKPLT